MTATPAFSDPDNLPDPALMALVRQGRKAAFECLVRRHQKALVNFFRSLGVYNDAEDMAQDTLIRLFKYRRRYRPTAKFTTFLYLLARQVWIDAMRRGKRRQAMESKAAERRRMADEEARSGFAGGPDIEQALASLTPAMRAVVTLSVYQGLTYDEIARVLGIPTGTVKSRMFQALRLMRSGLQGDAT